MNYRECLDYLDSISQKYGINYGLDTVKNLFDKAYNPHAHTKIIHVAGTNGKGSTSSYIAYILSEAGYKVGRYISPAVYDYREIIQYMDKGCINYITEDEIKGYINVLKGYADELYEETGAYPSVFEMETVMAFMAFDDWSCDYAIVECGMGGTLDATNAMPDKELCVFTSISEDHGVYLGDALADIARSKAGIMRRGVRAVSAVQNNDVIVELDAYAESADCAISYVDKCILTDMGIWGCSFKYCGKEWKISICGAHQAENASLAIEAVYALSDTGAHITDEIIDAALRKTRWPGRFDIIRSHPYVIADGAHNPDAVMRLMELMEHIFPGVRYKRIGIVGIFKDKDIDNIICNFSGHLDRIHTVTPPGPRGLDAGMLADMIGSKTGIMPYVHPDKTVYEVVDDITADMDEAEMDKCVIIIFGSLSLLGKN